MAKVIFFGILIAAGVFARPVAAGAQTHPHYLIDADIDVQSKRLNVRQELTFFNRTGTPMQELFLYVYPNRRFTAKEKKFMIRFAGYFKVNPYPDGFPESGMQIRSVRDDGGDLSYMITGEDRTLLKVALDRPVGPGESRTVEIFFDLKIPHAYGRFGWNENIIALSRWYPVLAVFDGEWRVNPFYPYHRPFFNEAGTYDVTLHLPREMVAAHSGHRLSGEDEPGGKKTVRIASGKPVREFSLALSQDFKQVSKEAGGVMIRSFYLPGNKPRAELAWNDARDLMADYTRRFGPYPYEEFSIVPVYLGYGGEQMGNMNFIDTRVYELPGFLDRYFDFLIAHETGHQWFFNLVGVNEFSQMWLEEGVNSYFIQQYLDDKYGPDALVIEYPDWLKAYSGLFPKLTFRQTRTFRYKLTARQGWDRPVLSELSSYTEPAGIFSVTYGKGAKVLEMLENLIGKEDFHRVFSRMVRAYSFRNIDIRDFERIVREETGQDYGWFFDEWLRSDRQLDMAVQSVRGRSAHLANKGGITMPLEVRLEAADGVQEEILWDPERDGYDLRAGFAEDITRVVIDPEGKTLDLDRTNNVWPRRLVVNPVPYYFGLYDLALFQDEGAYNVIVGPELSRGIGVKVSWQKPFEHIIYAGTSYEAGESLQHSRIGYQLENVCHSPLALGVELANTFDYDDGSDDVVSGKVYLRKELWPAPYGLGELNDHVTLYVIRNQRLDDVREFVTPREDTRNVDYSRRSEAIVGTALSLNRSGPYPDPVTGYTIGALLENAGHFWGAKQYFTRASLDAGYYTRLPWYSVLALRLKGGWGMPDDKDLFYIGGIDGIRGYARKTVRGAHALMGTVELRFPLKDNAGWASADHMAGIESIGGAVFVDAGQAWFNDFRDGELKKAVGAGLRFKINIGSFLEQVMVRADLAKAVNDSDEDVRFWLGMESRF